MKTHNPLSALPTNGKVLNGDPLHASFADALLPPNLETPRIAKAFELSDDQKIEIIERKFQEVLLTLGLDLDDDSLSQTPHRIAKMYVKELFAGLNPENAPSFSVFENKYDYTEMLLERDIRLQSMCEHHFMPIIGTAAVAYIPREKVVGLSKLNRTVAYFASRPQVQERLTRQIAEYLMRKLDTPDVAVLIDAEHQCVSMRGIKDPCSSTVTSSFHGAFRDPGVRAEFIKLAKG
jgi:GTP cyclohydrolase I